MVTFPDTVEFIKKAHERQVDKGGNPYYLHPLIVAFNVWQFFFYHKIDVSDEIVLIALLHDVLEDTEYTSKDLLEMGYSTKTVQAVEDLSRNKNMTYIEWIRSITNPLAIIVKIFDIEHNISSERRRNISEEKKDRYLKALNILVSTPTWVEIKEKIKGKQ